MAKKKAEPKIVIERTYNVPLRKGWLKVSRYKRSKKAVKTLVEFMYRHMKSENIKVGKYLNEKIWKHGIKNPPHHVQVKAIKNDEGKVMVELVGAPEEKPKEEKKPKKAAGEAKIKEELQKLKEKTAEIKKKEDKPGALKEEEVKPAEKTETKVSKPQKQAVEEKEEVKKEEKPAEKKEEVKEEKAPVKEENPAEK